MPVLCYFLCYFGFIGDEHDGQPDGLAFSLLDYLQLLDWSSRVVRWDKRGAQDEAAPQLLRKLGMDTCEWLAMAQHFGHKNHCAVGSVAQLSAYAAHTEKRWVSGQCQLQRCYH